MKTQAFNPYLPSYEYIPDAEPYVFGDRIYIYGSHDRFNGESYCLNDYVCWSAPLDDLGNWDCEGTIYKPTQDPLNTDGTQQGFAPDLQQGNDGRYYLYYALNRSPIISVAVCDTPAGQYEFYGHVRYSDGTVFGQKSGDVFNFDPGVLVDDDGRVYLYTGFSPKPGYLRDMLEQSGLMIDGAYCVELGPDMLTLKSSPIVSAPGACTAKATSFEEHAFYEASSPRKIGNIYYLIYSSEKSHELCYAVSDRPDSGYVFGGTIVSNGDVGTHSAGEALNYTGNTHGGIVQINGEWYVFYHRQTNGHHFSRQGCAERIEIMTDGSIAQVEMTSCGLNGGPLTGVGEYEARIACNLSGPEGTYEYGKEKDTTGNHPYFTQRGTDREEEGDQYIANIRDGAWAGYKYFVFQSEKAISVRVRGTASGIFKVSTMFGGEQVAHIKIHPTENWREYSAPLHILPGEHALYFRYEGNGSFDFISFRIE
ncbi:family 43 glycosylhydrolase [Paenibacillus sp. NPDC057886]|uniref:family 43 glycosylhydrolase n=1 Tax=Paenibacillus sp. NPDC057886 TaxID=3346270 RepID=UPI003684473E